MKAGFLFSGIGGFELAFQRAGFELAWSAEIDKHASGVLERRFPGVWNYGDVKAVMNGVPAIDVLCGGFPCQDLSVAGRRAGLAGERSGLWFEFHRIVGELLPQFVVIENVPGLLSSNRGADFAVILRGLVELGYRVAWRVLDAQYFGLAQRRKRVFIVASLGDGRCAEVLFESESLRGNPPARGEAGEGATYDLAPSLRASGVGTGRIGESDELEEGISPALRGADGGSSRGQIVFDPGQVTSKGNRSNPQPGDPSHTLTGFVPHVVGVLSDGAHHGGGLNGQDAYSGRGLAPLGAVRRLTPVECERLQCFPDNWTEGQADSHRYKQLGNAVAVPVVEWIARRIANSS